jgi:hypothetical protein
MAASTVLDDMQPGSCSIVHLGTNPRVLLRLDAAPSRRPSRALCSMRLGVPGIGSRGDAALLLSSVAASTAVRERAR